MNALNDIKDRAQVIVSDLALKQVNDMKNQFSEYKEWLVVDGGVISYGEVHQYSSIQKFVYMTQHQVWNGSERVLPTSYNVKDAVKIIRYDKSLDYAINNLHSQLRDNWDIRYMDDFIVANMIKLERALAKHLTNDMTASNISVNNGGAGAEVTATVDNKSFVTFGTLCGGYIQCLHYRYRSSLK